MDDERLRQLTVANGAFRLMYFVNVESRIVTLIDFQPTERFDPTKLLAAVRHFDS
jgi:mRNA-degrading endonuclease RelE of RelBE toxin-antitoxin system